MSALEPRPSGDLSSSYRSLGERRIDRQTSLEAYRHGRLTDLVVHKTANIDWAIAQRMRSGSILAEISKRTLEQTSEAAHAVFSAIEDREMLMSRLFRQLA